MSLFNEENGKLIETNQPQMPSLLPRRAFLRKSLLTGASASLLASAGAVGLELLGTLPAAAATGPGGNVQIVALDTAGVLWHTIRRPNGTWEGAFGNVNQQESNGGSLRFTDVSCASDSNGNVQVVASDMAGVLWHTIRHANSNGTWEGAFGNVNQQESNGGGLRFTHVSIA
jgi:hypothetical protein